jgi:hypothetical protein
MRPEVSISVITLRTAAGLPRNPASRHGHGRSPPDEVAGADCLIPAGADVLAQAVTTASVRGEVRRADGVLLDGPVVTSRNEANGFAAGSAARRGRFLVPGTGTWRTSRSRVRQPGFDSFAVFRSGPL